MFPKFKGVLKFLLNFFSDLVLKYGQTLKIEVLRNPRQSLQLRKTSMHVFMKWKNKMQNSKSQILHIFICTSWSIIFNDFSKISAKL